MLIAALIVIAACGGSDREEDFYNESLDLARRSVRADAESWCNPRLWDPIAAEVNAAEWQVPIMKLAIGDACIEAGELDLEYSHYYDD